MCCILFEFANDFLAANFDLVVGLWVLLGLFCFVLLFFVPAPYGKFYSETFPGFSVPGKIGWMAQEVISPLFLSLFFLPTFFSILSNQWDAALLWRPSVVAYLAWVIHYLHRSFIHPLKAPSMKPTSIFVVLSAVFFNIVNGSLNGWSLSQTLVSRNYSMRTTIGLGVMIWGFMKNIESDLILWNLRKGTNTAGKYFIPRGGLFELVSGANYFAEFMEWIGFAIIQGFSFASISFVIWTFANLYPRAVKTHDFYRQKFAKYPTSRTAFFPHVF
eukprot:TRINITY_DN60_c0_g1_i1.p1 TRINITY_DN60_c0_g1~~TRINITY_DN60_c0_g1_i1.p1  ORF type:complete len:273 (-),score=54.25 TRINITY_DN60_c0_g1_i1:201-1019(-)